MLIRIDKFNKVLIDHKIIIPSSTASELRTMEIRQVSGPEECIYKIIHNTPELVIAIERIPQGE